MGKQVYPYIIESDSGIDVVVFASAELQKERFVHDILQDADLSPEDYDEDQVAELKQLQQDHAPLEERHSLAETLYSNTGDMPYYTLEPAQRIVKRLPLTS